MLLCTLLDTAGVEQAATIVDLQWFNFFAHGPISFITCLLPL